MIEHIKELGFKPELYTLSQIERLRKVEVTPKEIRTAQSIASHISELTILQVVSAGASPRGGVDRGDESIGVEPLNRARLGHAGDRVVLVERYARNDTCELGSATLHDAIAIC